MKTLIENLCGKLEDWGIDPRILLKAISIFLTIVVLIIIFIKFPVLFGITWVSVTCVAIIAVIYLMLE